MITRTLLGVALLVSATGCAGSKQYAQLLAQVDGYTFEKPIAEVWPDALRFVAARGYGLVGADRKVLGDDPQSPWGAIFSKGHETYVEGRRWWAETAMNSRYQRYRIAGRAIGASTCRIEYFLITSEDPARLGNLDQADAVSRDVDLELAFIASVDPEGAARISRAAVAAQ
jgi:hypothetical protein